MRKQSETFVRDIAKARRLNSALCRLAQLERLAGDPVYIERLVAAGRMLRLSAAIAWASEIVERARAAGGEDIGPPRRTATLH